MTIVQQLNANANRYDTLAHIVRDYREWTLTDIYFTDAIAGTDTNTMAFDDHYTYLESYATCKAADLRDMAARMVA